MGRLIPPHFSELPPLLKTAINQGHYTRTLCPNKEAIFHAFYHFYAENTKVVILGQDPYHTPGKANGLAFGHNPYYGGPVNASLKNVFKECLESAGQCTADPTLTTWAQQGVLLLNTKLTTLEGRPNAHKNIGWEEVVTDYLKKLDKVCRYKVYMLWGREAQSYREHLDERNNLILEAAHPSPFSARRGFFGCDHFAAANDYLERKGRGKIEW